MILGLLASALACPSTATLTNAEATLADAEPALAAKAIDGAMIAISTCTEPIDPQLLARIWLVRGIASQLLGEDPEVYYQAALRADETVWDDLFSDGWTLETWACASGANGWHV